MTILNRRALVAGAAALGVAAPALAQARKIKVAAIYTVPVEQQWVSRIHKAINAAVARGEAEYAWSENVSNSDYERVMREYAQKGADLVVGEAFGGSNQLPMKVTMKRTFLLVSRAPSMKACISRLTSGMG